MSHGPLSSTLAAERALHTHFEALHAGSADPWRYADSWYESRKRALTLAMLSRPRYRQAFEPGCSVGVLSEALAGRCDSLLCWDASPSAVGHARQRLAAHPHVTVAQRELRESALPGGFDLIVFSELGYYLAPATLQKTIRALERALSDDGELIACHWRHPLDDGFASGDHIHEQLHAGLSLAHVSGLVERDFRLDLWSSTAGSSTAGSSTAGASVKKVTA